MRAVQSVALALCLCLPVTAVADEEGSGIVLEHIPRGEVIERDGDEVIVYTFEQFQRIAELDVRMTGLLEELETTRALLENRRVAYSECDDALSSLRASFDAVSGQYAECAQQRDRALDGLSGCADSLGESLEQSRRSGRAGRFAVHVVSVLSGVVVGLLFEVLR